LNKTGALLLDFLPQLKIYASVCSNQPSIVGKIERLSNAPPTFPVSAPSSASSAPPGPVLAASAQVSAPPATNSTAMSSTVTAGKGNAFKLFLEVCYKFPLFLPLLPLSSPPLLFASVPISSPTTNSIARHHQRCRFFRIRNAVTLLWETCAALNLLPFSLSSLPFLFSYYPFPFPLLPPFILIP
jgi:hypothetical protein